jgi:exodeoxyribonuclease VII large subunit
VDLSLAELAADQRASTPSNAAQLLVPDKRHELQVLHERQAALAAALDTSLGTLRQTLAQARAEMDAAVTDRLTALTKSLRHDQQMLKLFNPEHILARGYALVYHHGQLVRSAGRSSSGETLTIKLHDGTIEAQVN